MTARRVRAVALSVLVAVALTACSGGDSGTASSRRAPATSAASTAATTGARQLHEYDVPAGSHPHDVAVANDGTVWYTAQAAGKLGRFHPASGDRKEVALGRGSAPHGVIIGPDGAPWITDGGLNAIVRVDPVSLQVRAFSLPADRGNANLNTAVFDTRGTLWFTGQSGVYGRLSLPEGKVDVFDAPGGAGPYGITATPNGEIYYASLAGSYVGRIDAATGKATALKPPTANQGTRRVWSDSQGRIWCSQWNAGQVAVYDPATGGWREWKLPGARPQAYAVFVDDRDVVWLTDFGGNALVRFDPASESFTSFALPSHPGEVRQLHGRPGEVWGAESAADKLVVLRT